MRASSPIRCSSHQRRKAPAARAYAARVFGLRMLTVKNSRKRSEARSPAPAINAGTFVPAARGMSAIVGSGMSAPRRVFFQKSFKQRFRPVESRVFQFFDRLGKINQPKFRRNIKHAERAGDAQAFSFRHANPIPLIHEQQVGMEGFRERDSGGFSGIEAGYQGQADGVMDFKPGGGRGDPMFYRQRGARAGKFGLDGHRKSDLFKHAGKQINIANLNQVTDGAGVGNYQLHGLKSKLF